ncbi:antitoxin Xre/MbcA/ParS toxin-binding domain-containing protein [Azospirillum rugosum]|uniref:Toxin-antitoxin system antitoxin component (TIGR02293 family) n=1 Tax=Azospirillum rugosum TaxID=416170 RepID=A0ABS4STU1_9PROT|nr:antitoxin Xre/MbcA/ParS toxin-binding domain-containing protein [Azospirillum rugosum]MBP2295523.1 putative toxin-antitoxin system antitoxin component (TIGR02293 family) [Azospirillum rugosum]MDQ0528402.1 putative toxin-antitoxin system antitoxin component (TIGR02293 family) [Azospirillum rugosum]
MGDEMTPEDFLPADARARFDRIRAAAREVFGDDYKARDFLVRPHPRLGSRRPMELLLTEGDDGVRRVQDILRVHRTATKQ